MTERATRHTLAELSDKVDLWIDDLDELPFGSGRVAKLRRVINHRRRRLAQ